jgi:hypothetical protein
MSKMNGNFFGITSTSIVHPDGMALLQDEMLKIMNLGSYCKKEREFNMSRAEDEGFRDCIWQNRDE